MKIPEFLKMEYMDWRGKAFVVAGLVMLICIIFIVGLYEGYKLTNGSLQTCQSALQACRTLLSAG